MDKRKYKQMLLPLLLMVLVLVGGGGCSDDEEPAPEDYGYLEVKLNTNDHRFENLKTMDVIKNAHCAASDFFDIYEKNDSIFISYYGILLYPTRLPDDFSISTKVVVFTGAIKQKPDGVDYYPLILYKFKYASDIKIEF